MSAPKLLAAPVQTQDPHQAMHDALVKAQNDLGKNKPKEAVILELRATTLKLMLRAGEGSELALDLRKTYLSAELIINDGKAKKLTSLIDSETKKIGKTQTAQTYPEKEGFIKKQQEINKDKLQDSRDFERLLVSSIQRMSVSPTMFYGVIKEDESPAWAKSIMTLTNKGDPDAVAAFIKSDPELAGKPQLQAILLDAAKSKDNLEAMFSQLTLSQKAIDGISLMMKGKYGGIRVSEDDLRQFFRGLNLSDDEMKSALDFANGNQSNGDKIVGKIFDRLQQNSKAAPELLGRVTSLVIDANFGENAAGLNALISDMGGVPSQDSIANLKEFYRCLMGANGLGSAENKAAFNQLGSELTDRLVNDRQYIGDPTSGVHRDNFDVSLLYAFAYSCKNSPDGYFQSPLFRKQSSQFLDIVSGGGALPSAVPLTIVQNREMLDFMYDNFRQDESGFFDVMSALTNRVTSIYSRPLESKFNPEARVSTRFEAADKLVKGITELKGNALLDDMLSRFVDTTYVEDQNMIKLRSPFSMVLLGNQQDDWNNIKAFMRSMNVTPAVYSDTEQQYRNMLEFSRRKTPGVSMPRPQEMKYNLLRKLPQTYLYGMDEIYGGIVATRDYFKPSQATGNGNLDYRRETTDVKDATTGKISEGMLKRENVKGTGSLGLSGPVGSINTRFNAYTTRDMGDIRTGSGSETIFNSSQTEARNLYLGQVEINEAFLNWTESKGSQLELGEISSSGGYNNDLNFKLRGIAYGAGLLLMGERRFDDQGNSKLYLEAVINDGSKYLRVVNLDKFVNDAGYKDLEKKVEAHMKYAEACQWALPIGTYAAYETQNRNVPVGFKGGNYPLNPDGTTQTLPGTRNGFIIGAGNVWGDHRLAGLTVKTADGSELALGSYGNFKSASNSSALVVTGGYLLFRDQTDMFGRNRRANYEQRISTPVVGSEFMSNNPMYMFSAMTDKFYGLALGSRDVAGGQLGTSLLGGNFSVGGILRYEGGPRAYMYNGQYFGSGFSATAYAEGGDEKQKTVSGAARIDMGKGWALNIYGLESTNPNMRSGFGLTGSQNNPQAKALLQGISGLGTEIFDAVNDEKSAWNKDENQRNQLMRNWTGQMAGYLDQASRFLPSEAVNNLKSQFSIGIEKPGDAEIKLAIVKLGGQDAASQETNYLVTMDRIRAGESIVSFTAGVPVPMKDQYVGKDAVRNFAGVNLNVGNLTFGATGYNLGSSEPAGMKFDVVHVDDGWAKGVSASFLGQGGHRETLFIGNREMKFSLGNTNAKGLSSQEIAASYMLAARYNLGGYWRTSGMQAPNDESVRLNEAGVNLNYTSIEGMQLGAQLFITHGKGGKLGTTTVNIDGGVRLNFRLVF